MPQQKKDTFADFTARRKKDLQRIARATNGEYQLSDVISEAWLISFDLTTNKGITEDFGADGFQNRLLSHVYQRLVRFNERNIRFAIQLDHGAKGSDQEGQAHPLLGKLVADDGRDPLAILVEDESKTEQEVEPESHQSLAGAYLHLLRHFDSAMPAVARHLMISTSYAYRRCADARGLAIHQTPIPIPTTGNGFMPGPWRPFQIKRTPVQLMLDFDDEPTLQFVNTVDASAACNSISAA